MDAQDSLAYLAIRPVIQSYRIAARSLASMQKTLFTAKEFSKRALSVGEAHLSPGSLCKGSHLSDDV